jgi:DNA-binding transcriptional MocR family regulator
MVDYLSMDADAIRAEHEALFAQFEAAKAKNLHLNMARGKPSSAQLDLISDMLAVLTTPDECTDEGIDARNYGELAGLPCAKEYWSDVLGCKPDQTFVGGASSLTLMYDLISKAYTHGLVNSPKPWCKEDRLKFLCPAPGYDRHFRITESFGFELITVPMTADGPDMDSVEALVTDPAVKGIWCVPKYSNPQGIIYSNETVRRLAALHPAAPDFVIMWDNAYCIHEFEGDFVPFQDIICLCEEAGNPNMVYEFASTSKITFPGSGISVMASSEENIRYMTKLMGVQMISYDKVNQMRHVKYLRDKAHTLSIMKRHASVMAPKFEAVLQILDRELNGLGIASWLSPKGGYFVSLDSMPGTAKRTLQLCAEAGVVMTNAGATYPYGIDPLDSNIRIAPSYPPLHELQQAMEVFCICLKLAATEKILNQTEVTL